MAKCPKWMTDLKDSMIKISRSEGHRESLTRLVPVEVDEEQLRQKVMTPFLIYVLKDALPDEDNDEICACVAQVICLLCEDVSTEDPRRSLAVDTAVKVASRSQSHMNFFNKGAAAWAAAWAASANDPDWEGGERSAAWIATSYAAAGKKEKWERYAERLIELLKEYSEQKK